MNFINEKKHQLILQIVVIPNSQKTEIVGVINGELKIKVNAVPEKGRANKVVIEFLAKLTGVAKSNWEVIRGQTSRHKQITVGIEYKSKVEEALNYN